MRRNTGRSIYAEARPRRIPMARELIANPRALLGRVIERGLSTLTIQQRPNCSSNPTSSGLGAAPMHRPLTPLNDLRLSDLMAGGVTVLLRSRVWAGDASGPA